MSRKCLSQKPALDTNFGVQGCPEPVASPKAVIRIGSARCVEATRRARKHARASHTHTHTLAITQTRTHTHTKSGGSVRPCTRDARNDATEPHMGI